MTGYGTCEMCIRNNEIDIDLGYPATEPNEADGTALIDGEFLAVCLACVAEQRHTGADVDTYLR